MEMQDGVILEGGLKALHEGALVLPAKQWNWSVREFLKIRFSEFRGWSWDGW